MKKNILKVLVSIILIFTTITTTSSAFAFEESYTPFEGVSSIFTIRPLADDIKGTEEDWTLWSEEKLERYWYETRVEPRELNAEFMIELHQGLQYMGLPHINFGEITPELILEIQEALDWANSLNLDFSSYYSGFYRNEHSRELQSISPLMLPDYTPLQGLVARLSIFDGVSLLQVNTAGNLGNLSIAEGRQIYPHNYRDGSQWMRNDAFRHFTWSLRSARQIGWRNAMIITNNYEFAPMMLNAYTEYFNRIREELLTNPWLSNWTYLQIRASAEGAALSFALDKRERIANEAAVSDAAFRRVFGDDSIMDFWNNWAGFAFIGSADHINAFYDEIERGVIILGECYTHTRSRINRLRVQGYWRHF